MAHYFASDVHLRPDYPGRGVRFHEFVSSLQADDSLTIVGDLCDFWMGARMSEREIGRCEGMPALAEFRRRGGTLAIMAGNHDLWLCPLYERLLDASIIEEPFEQVVNGLKIHLVHGHLLGARARWKGFMESRAFFRGFGALPKPVAVRLDAMLARKNSRELFADEERHLAIYRTYAGSLVSKPDLAILGHVHRPVDEATGGPRLIVLGGWQRGSSFLKIDEKGASFLVRPAAKPNHPEHVLDR